MTNALPDEKAVKLQALIDKELAATTDIMLAKLAKSEARAILKELVHNQALKFLSDPKRQDEIKQVLLDAWNESMVEKRPRTVSDIADAIKNALDHCCYG